MALKAYRHLTDGEVKIVVEGSAEETALVADTVQGGSYLQLTSTGHSQEVPAAQGTALWVDVTSDLGSGGGGGLPTGMDYHLFEETALEIPAGTNWSVTGHALGSIEGLSAHNLVQAKFTIELDVDPATATDWVWLVADDTGVWATDTAAAYLRIEDGGTGTGTGNFSIYGVTSNATARRVGNMVSANNIDILSNMAGSFDPDPLPDPFTFYVYVRTSGVTTVDMTAHVRAAFLIL